MARPKALTKVQRARVCAKFVGGEPIKNLAEEYGVADSTIRAVLADAGVTMKDRSQAKDASRAEKTAAAAQYAAVNSGDLDDPLECANVLYKYAVISAMTVATDSEYPGTEAERRKEIASLSASAQKLMPIATMRAARKALEADAKAMKEGGGPEVKRVKRKVRRK